MFPQPSRFHRGGFLRCSWKQQLSAINKHAICFSCSNLVSDFSLRCKGAKAELYLVFFMTVQRFFSKDRNKINNLKSEVMLLVGVRNHLSFALNPLFLETVTPSLHVLFFGRTLCFMKGDRFSVDFSKLTAISRE